jgi:hypothetical protein
MGGGKRDLAAGTAGRGWQDGQACKEWVGWKCGII